MTSYTKGPWVRMSAEPWTVDNDDAYGHSYTGIGAEQEHPIALVVAAGYQSNECFDANARLIAAAPELLEQLHKMTEHYVRLAGCGDCGNWNPEEEDEVIAARATIAKATNPPPATPA